MLKDGVRRGDVAMIYVYRGVDLVVAVMGVLLAGAAFSVVCDLLLMLLLKEIEVLILLLGGSRIP